MGGGVERNKHLAEVIPLRPRRPRAVPLEAAVQLTIDNLDVPQPVHERNVQRIDGERVHLHSLSDEELESYMIAADKRRQAAEDDLDILGAENARRMEVVPDSDTVDDSPIATVARPGSLNSYKETYPDLSPAEVLSKFEADLDAYRISVASAPKPRES